MPMARVLVIRCSRPMVWTVSNALSMHEALRQLDLSGNKISFAGACHLATGVKDNTTLQKLNLANNKIRVDGLYRLAQVVIGHPSMVCIDLRGVPLRRTDKRRLEMRTAYCTRRLALPTSSASRLLASPRHPPLRARALVSEHVAT